MTSDILIIGSGIAGLIFALKASEHGRVIIATKKGNAESSTNYAQGGIACVLGDSDSFDKHIRDTLKCGKGLSKKDVVEAVVRQGPDGIRELIQYGARFCLEESDSSHFSLGREGGHSERRIVHAEDLTGREVEQALLRAVASRKNIRVLEHHFAVDLILGSKVSGKRTGPRDECWGAYVMNTKTRKIAPYLAKVTVLATGGSGRVYLYTSNPDIATGDGLAMAYRAGARLANLEFVQFHPTCLFHPVARSFLISEAVRGEGAVLRTVDGKAFMERYHKDGSLAPRDIVARAIDREMKKRGDKYVFLDITRLGADKVKKRFPNIYEKCLSVGVDVTKEFVPVVPAAHYMCGGVITDICGRTSLRRLFACGETSHTGMHGANRLASNSLLEAVVMSRAAAECAREFVREEVIVPDVPQWQRGRATKPKETVAFDHNWDEVRRLMWDFVGIVRSNERLSFAKKEIALLREEIESFYWKYILDADLIELRNIALVAELIITCASRRKESRGLHYNIDYPMEDDLRFKKDTVISKGN
ncbi:MAG: L-aspartate oxidase [Candidatus Eisenbacteria bacterium]|nr:L-aspartate oxidase [Candidatus Eisenbacteria bacterium]